MIPYIMNDAKTLSSVASDTSNGLGRLAECVSLKICESLDNKYTATMEVPLMAYNSGLLHHDGIIKAMDSNGTQLFRINRFAKSLRDGMITCYLNHISYDMEKMAVKWQGNVLYTPEDVIDRIYSLAVTSVPFNITTQVTGSETMRFPIPLTVKGTICDVIVETFGGEVVYDNLDVTIVPSRGEDKTQSVVIEYGKNILDANLEREISDIFTGAIGFANTPDFGVAVIGSFYEKGTPTNHKVQIIDWSDRASKDPNYGNPNTALNMVNNWTSTYVNSADFGLPKVTMSIDLLSLERIGEYELIQNMQKLNLGDTVKVKIKPIGIDITARVIEREYDSLAERTTKVQIGDYVQSLADTIIGMNAKNQQDIAYIKTAYAKTATTQTNGLMTAADKAKLDSI